MPSKPSWIIAALSLGMLWGCAHLGLVPTAFLPVPETCAGLCSISVHAILGMVALAGVIGSMIAIYVTLKATGRAPANPAIEKAVYSVLAPALGALAIATAGLTLLVVVIR